MKWSPDDFQLETTSIWSFLNRGDWATHKSDYRGNWSPYVPRNIILRYSKLNDIVLDQFLGSGTTLIETKLLGRNGIGIDINPLSLEIATKRTSFKTKNNSPCIIQQGDAQNLAMLNDSSIDLIITHPPYANIIKYSEAIPNDLSLCEYEEFLHGMEPVAKECHRVLKTNKFCAIMIGDIREHGFVKPLGFRLLDIFLQKGFLLKELIIKEQHNCKCTPLWLERSKQYNFLLLAHEYIFIFKKP